MRVTVFGATGRIGTEVVRQGLAAGHEVVAVVRDPGRLGVPAGPGLGVVTADVMDPSQIGPAVKGADAVVSALGPRPGGPVTVLADSAGSILTALSQTGVDRMVVVSASGAFIEPDEPFVTRVLAKPLLQRILRDSMADTQRMEAEIRASGTDWTLIRPPQLTNRPGRGRYRRMIDHNVGRRIARADVADAILATLADPATIGHVVGVGY
jgi:putative NADH-flavin reductase